ncbi:Phage protein [Devosia sp. DBB001]|nr:Phage protein [Devosia sp. DBB001]
MAYCTLEQLIDRYGNQFLVDATDREGAATGEINLPTIDRAIADADALIDGYLAARYSLPIATTPELVRELSLTISAYKAHSQVTSEKIRKDYEDAIKALLQISRGDIRLNIDGAEPSTAGATLIKTNNPERPMTAESMKGYI